MTKDEKIDFITRLVTQTGFLQDLPDNVIDTVYSKALSYWKNKRKQEIMLEIEQLQKELDSNA